MGLVFPCGRVHCVWSAIGIVVWNRFRVYGDVVALFEPPTPSGGCCKFQKLSCGWENFRCRYGEPGKYFWLWAKKKYKIYINAAFNSHNLNQQTNIIVNGFHFRIGAVSIFTIRRLASSLCKWWFNVHLVHFVYDIRFVFHISVSLDVKLFFG